MVENSNGNGRVVECIECEPPRRFKNKGGSTAIRNSSMAVYLIAGTLYRTVSKARSGPNGPR